MRHDSSIQFNLAPAPAPPQPPEWLKALGRFLDKIFEPVGRFLNWLGSFFPDIAFVQFLLWAVIGLGAAALLWALYNRIRHGEWRLRPPRLGSVQESAIEEEW